MNSPDDDFQVTPESVYLDRRAIVAGMAASGLIPQLALGAPASFNARRTRTLPDTLTSYEDVTNYNNFYEFGTDKEDPAKYAKMMRSRPWTITIDGLVKKPVTIDVDRLIAQQGLEERIYRHRCVETWSMVIPWTGFPLAKLLAMVEPLSSAKYVAFESLHDIHQMPGQRANVLQWPYREGLRIDEATHPLAFMAVGLYGRVLPNQNGAPIRLVVPWKYGYKSIKSIVRIKLVDRQPATSWNLSAPREYGFYSNVNPDVDHPRWSQKRERRIGEWLPRRTLPFNGYAEEVAPLYRGMNLARYF